MHLSPLPPFPHVQLQLNSHGQGVHRKLNRYSTAAHADGRDCGPSSNSFPERTAKSRNVRAWKNASRIGLVSSSQRSLWSNCHSLPMPSRTICSNHLFSGRSGRSERSTATSRSVFSCKAYTLKL